MKSNPVNILLFGAAKNLKKNDKGLYIQWSVKSPDGDDLKIYIENGCIANLKPKEIREKYPQFKKYSYATFNSALSGIRKSHNNQIRNRAVNSCKLFRNILS